MYDAGKIQHGICNWNFAIGIYAIRILQFEFCNFRIFAIRIFAIIILQFEFCVKKDLYAIIMDGLFGHSPSNIISISFKFDMRPMKKL